MATEYEEKNIGKNAGRGVTRKSGREEQKKGLTLGSYAESKSTFARRSVRSSSKLLDDGQPDDDATARHTFRVWISSVRLSSVSSPPSSASEKLGESRC